MAFLDSTVWIVELPLSTPAAAQPFSLVLHYVGPRLEVVGHPVPVRGQPCIYQCSRKLLERCSTFVNLSEVFLPGSEARLLDAGPAVDAAAWLVRAELVPTLRVQPAADCPAAGQREDRAVV